MPEGWSVIETDGATDGISVISTDGVENTRDGISDGVPEV
jgi:hypothetical protein